MKTLELLSQRTFYSEKYTISDFYIENNVKFSNILEDKVRDLNRDGDLKDAGETKVWGKTAIPAGRYKVTIAPTSIKLWPEYVKRFGQVLPLLHNVEGFSSIRMHHGTDETNTEGCLIVGKNKAVGKVLESRDTLYRLMEILTDKNVSEIYITVKDKKL